MAPITNSFFLKMFINLILPRLLNRMISLLSNSEEKTKLKERLSKDQLQTVIDELLLLKSWRSRT